MSRIGNNPVAIPGGVELKLDNDVLTVKGPKGELTQAFGSLYVFFGAAVNSTHRLMTTLNRRSRTEKLALVGGVATASFLVALFN